MERLSPLVPPENLGTTPEEIISLEAGIMRGFPRLRQLYEATKADPNAAKIVFPPAWKDIFEHGLDTRITDGAKKLFEGRRSRRLDTLNETCTLVDTYLSLPAATWQDVANVYGVSVSQINTRLEVLNLVLLYNLRDTVGDTYHWGQVRLGKGFSDMNIRYPAISTSS